MSFELMAGRNLARKLRKGGSLPARDWLLLVQAAVWFPAVDLGLRLLPLRRLLALSRWRVRPSAPPIGVTPERVSRLVEAVARIYPFRATCLKKAIVLYALLTRRGVKAQLLLGAVREDGRLDAHAWLEYEGKVPSAGSGSGRYSILYCFDNSVGVTTPEWQATL